jgi:sigma-B regulation protein RsbU (phosphoserine phosphatase)
MEHFRDPKACVDGLIAEVKRHGGRSAHTDDATAVLVRSR